MSSPGHRWSSPARAEAAPHRVGAAEEFRAALLFRPTRALFEEWMLRTGPGQSVPRLADMRIPGERDAPTYLYAWEARPEIDDLVCLFAAPHLHDFAERGDATTTTPLRRGVRFSTHAPGPLGAAMRANHLRCISEETPFAVVRTCHVFPEQGSAYEAIVLPVRAGTGPRADALIGHLMPFPAETVMAGVVPAGMPIDRGVCLARD